MRQLKGGSKKETKKEKKERRQDNLESHQSIFRIVVPTLLAIVVAIITFVYVKSRPALPM